MGRGLCFIPHKKCLKLLSAGMCGLFLFFIFFLILQPYCYPICHAFLHDYMERNTFYTGKNFCWRKNMLSFLLTSSNIWTEKLQELFPSVKGFPRQMFWSGQPMHGCMLWTSVYYIYISERFNHLTVITTIVDSKK